MSGYTHTPQGLKPSHCVRQVPSGSVIYNEEKHIRIKHPSGEEELFPYCDPDDKKSNESRRWLESGWSVAGEAGDHQSNFNSFTGSWDVPTAPQYYHYNVDYFFIGLQPLDPLPTTIQSVLQWAPGTDGQVQWGIASWYDYQNRNYIYSELIAVNTGDRINGTIEMSTSGDWYIGVSANEGDATYLYQNSLPVMINAVVVVEVDSVNRCDEYPPDNQIKFTSLELHERGVPSYPIFIPTIFYTDCQQDFEMSSNSEITIVWVS